ncbi:MAG TPA: type II secretion system protein [Thermoanaerobaculia bacterium]|nr:type II secretion system protein [Thermoanaerobaculia bacterium]
MERRTTRGKRSEQGFTLAALIVILTIMMVFVAYTVPRQWSTVIRREREKQAIFVMRQYARAIYNFQKKNNTYPVSMEQLAKARQPRWLRGNGEGIPDPLTGEMDWLLVPAAAAGLQGGGGGTRPPGTVTGTQGQQPGTTIPALPMKDYAGGPFIGVRPPKTGKSILTLNGADQYDQWTFTAVELKAEIDARAVAAATIYR